MSPIRARKARLHVGHMWVGADVAVDAALALRTARLVCASLMRLDSAAESGYRFGSPLKVNHFFLTPNQSHIPYFIQIC